MSSDTVQIDRAAKLSDAALSQFTGSEYWYRHGIVRNILFTDGAKYVADEGGAYWLIDEIAFAQRFEKRVAAEEFQVWKLTVKPDHTAPLVGQQASPFGFVGDLDPLTLGGGE